MFVGFWSYVRDDDDADGGRITRLSERVRDEYAMLTGSSLEVFVDREAIEWGQEWQQRIDGALADTAFFVPVLTPRYFASEACRAELLTFAGHAASLGVSELLMPLYYVEVPGMSAESEDELVALVARTQYFDWRQLRMEEEGSSLYRKGVNELARRLASIAAQPVEVPVAVGATPDEESSGAGLLETMADAEEAVGRVPVLLEHLNEVMESIAEAVNRAAAEGDRITSGKVFAARLAIAHRLASQIEDPAADFKRTASDYASDMVSVDAGILTIIREFEAGEAEDPEQAEELFESIRELAGIMEEMSGRIDEFLTVLPRAGSLSRELRRPMADLQEGALRMKDGNAVVSEWRRRIEGLDAAT